uniref:Uncharacterized protein n=1 Tax=Chromera velia CCMP2878 TaxID=1169474 RepID=A0A0G4HBL9_9ALVE|eukprot:Cvel_25851.t1-p1 / transcript=Cvel_25851.t1 / gene=Cvel_25851 / organism=Chromera_velia_CCMP2878 / gene_product=hypothetical protein / transcript_product=hypothetical protein / location=Cvel_scaffold2981:2638-3111(-) / protein_length=158 / sequence_SO=supercontig / SO=protein_coding / is_pseudo=false
MPTTKHSSSRSKWHAMRAMRWGTLPPNARGPASFATGSTRLPGKTATMQRWPGSRANQEGQLTPPPPVPPHRRNRMQHRPKPAGQAEAAARGAAGEEEEALAWVPEVAEAGPARDTGPCGFEHQTDADTEELIRRRCQRRVEKRSEPKGQQGNQSNRC